MKKLTKLISFAVMFIFLMSFLSCGVTKEEFKLEKRAPFLISQVYIKQWASGVRDGSKGDDVYVSIEKFKRRDADITFQQLFFKDQVANLQKPSEYRNQYLESANYYVAYFKDGQTNDVLLTDDSEADAPMVSLDQFPFELTKSEAVISYEYFGKTRYFKIPYVETVGRIGYPATDPNAMEEEAPTGEPAEDMDQK